MASLHRCLLQALFWIVPLASFSAASPLPGPFSPSLTIGGAGNVSVSTNGTAALRDVFITVDVNYQLPRLAPDGLRCLGGHAALIVNGSSTDGPLQIEIVLGTSLAMRVYDWQVANSNRPIAPNGTAGCSRRVWKLGQVAMTNRDFMDPVSGNGLVMDLYRWRPGYLSGQNSGLHFVTNLAYALGWNTTADFVDLFTHIQYYEQQPPLLQQDHLPLLLEQVNVWGDRSKNSLTIFTTNSISPSLNSSTMAGPRNITLLVQNATMAGLPNLYPDSAEDPAILAALRQPLPEPWDHTVARAGPYLSRRAGAGPPPMGPPSAFSVASQISTDPLDSAVEVDPFNNPPPEEEEPAQARPPKRFLTQKQLQALQESRVAFQKLQSWRQANPTPYFEITEDGRTVEGKPIWQVQDVLKKQVGNPYRLLAMNAWDIPSTGSGSGSGSGAQGSGGVACPRDLTGRCAGAPSAAEAEVELAKPRSYAVGRVNTILTSVEVADLSVAWAGVGTAIAVAFIVVDFVNGNYVGGGFAVAGVTLGIVAAALLEGPVGFLVAGLIALFSILPSISNPPKSSPPPLTDAKQIVQWAMFGDKDHVDTQQCQNGTLGQPGNPNCTAVYGPGVIGSVFNWNNFDPIAFLLANNHGYPMTIAEMAAAFTVVDPSRDSNLYDNYSAIITCDQTQMCTGNDACYAPDNPHLWRADLLHPKEPHQHP